MNEDRSMIFSNTKHIEMGTFVLVNWKFKWIYALFMVIVHESVCVRWNDIRCSADPDQDLSDGYIPNIGRFPWLGVVQHNFYLGGRIHFAVTSGILIHPAYAVAPADDIAKIPFENLENNTKLILWYSKEVKYAIDVKDYVLHPEFQEKVTTATIALLQLETRGETGAGDNPEPVLPICVPTKEFGTLTDLYAVRMTDARGELEKEAFSMDFVDDRDCDEFYYQHGLTSKMHRPMSPTCAVPEHKDNMSPCVWDAGAALITRQSWGHWKLLGFSVRGPGCSAPSRFLNLYDYLPWINDLATPLPVEEVTQLHRIGVRRFSPIKIILYSAKKIIPKEQGQCDRKLRGSVVYKDAFEVLITKNFGQGFFFVVVNQISSFTCAIVNMMDVTARSNAAMWIEHNCHRDMLGTPQGQEKPRDYRKQECFLYFKSAVFLEFRFYFSFKASVESTIYGIPENPRLIPNPFMTDETTLDWYPTKKLIAWSTFDPSDFFWSSGNFYTVD